MMKQKSNIKFALRLWYFRLQSGLTQQELSEKTGISRDMILKMENGSRAMTIENAVALARAMNVNLDTFLAEQITITI